MEPLLIFPTFWRCSLNILIKKLYKHFDFWPEIGQHIRESWSIYIQKVRQISFKHLGKLASHKCAIFLKKVGSVFKKSVNWESTTIPSFILPVRVLKSQDEDGLGIGYGLLYYASKENARWMNCITTEAAHINQNWLLHKLILELELFTSGYQLILLSLKLLYEMRKAASISSTDLGYNFTDINKLLNITDFPAIKISFFG
jgi:hypothetical protein